VRCSAPNPSTRYLLISPLSPKARHSRLVRVGRRVQGRDAARALYDIWLRIRLLTTYSSLLSRRRRGTVRVNNFETVLERNLVSIEFFVADEFWFVSSCQLGCVWGVDPNGLGRYFLSW
jgi:hypothetical protein